MDTSSRTPPNRLDREPWAARAKAAESTEARVTRYLASRPQRLATSRIQMK